MVAYGATREKDFYGSQTFCRETGIYISRLEQYERSLPFFDRALKIDPDDKRAILGRLRARAKSINYTGALADINRYLELCPDDLIALADKALVTYLCNEFEQSLTQNAKLLPLRQKPDHFQMGVMQCKDAIENCLSERAGRPLRDYFKIIRKLAWKRNHDENKEFEYKPRKSKRKHKPKMDEVFAHRPKTAPHEQESKSFLKTTSSGPIIKDSLHSVRPDSLVVLPLEYPYRHRPLQSRTTNIENFMAERYLDCMYLDKQFLKKIPNLPGATSPNKKGSKRILQLAKSCYHTVSYKQEIMRTRRPFYFIKYQEAKISGNLKIRQAQEQQWQKDIAKKDADVLLSKLRRACEEKKLRVILELAEKLRLFCNSKPKAILPDKEIYMEDLRDMVCQGYYQVFRTSKTQSTDDQDYRIKVLLGLEERDKSKADSVLDFLAENLVDHKKKIETYENYLEVATTPDEICWYYYELARNHYDIGKQEIARVYLRKCIQLADDVHNLQWTVIPMMLMVRSDLQQTIKRDAISGLLRVQALSKEIQDPKLLSFIQRSLAIVEKCDLRRLSRFAVDPLESRESTIKSLMSTDEMKLEVAHLFSQMSAMPASRRLSIMPGASSKDGVKHRGKTRMSILPAPEASPYDDEKRESLAKPPEKGAEFLDFIQSHA